MDEQTTASNESVIVDQIGGMVALTYQVSMKCYGKLNAESRGRVIGLLMAMSLIKGRGCDGQRKADEWANAFELTPKQWVRMKP